MKIFSLGKTPTLIALVAFLTRAGYFMSLPFLAIYLAREGLFTAGQIGIILGASALFYSTTGLINGVVIEHFSKRKILILSLIVTSCCYLGISFSSHSFWALVLFNSLLGWVRSVGDIAAITLLVQNTSENNLRESYSLRFMAVNTGAMIGPLIGALLSYQKSLAIFMVSGTIHLSLAFYLFFISMTESHTPQEKTLTILKKNISIIFHDRNLRNMTLINLLIWVVYSQMDSTIPQFLTHHSVHAGLILGMMISLNAIMCILFSSRALLFTENYSIKIAGIIGSFLMAAAFILIGVAPTAITFIMFGIITAWGELFTVLANSLNVSKIAPKHLISSYNGFLSIGSLGLTLGPIIGGYGLQFMGGKNTFLLLIIFPLICAWFYFSED